MRSLTFVHTADLHLDLPVQGWKGSREQWMIRREEYRRTFTRIIDLVKERSARFLFIAGDFLEHDYVERSTIRFVMEELRKIPDTRVWIAPGNHDPWRSDSCYRLTEWPNHVHIFSDRWEEHHLPEEGVRIYGKGFADVEEPAPVLPEVRGEERRIMVVHGTYLTREDSTPYFPILASKLAALDLDYVALGHIHQPATYRLDNRRKTVVRYPGSPEALRWKEIGERTVTVGTLDSRGITLEMVPVHTRRYEIHHMDITGLDTPDQVIRRLLEEIPPGDERRVYRRVILRGRRPRDVVFVPEWFHHRLTGEGFDYVEVLDETRPDFDLESLRCSNGLAGVFIRKMEQRLKQADPREREVLERALFKGLDALLTPEVSRR